MTPKDPLASVEIKALVPAKDFELSMRFYQELGFRLASAGGGIAYFHHGDCAFLLQNFYRKEHADNYAMHWLVDDADAWRAHVEQQDLANKYPGVSASPPGDRPWGVREFTLIDPSGVCWHIGHNIAGERK